MTCPPFIVISCETDTTPSQLGMAIAMDNCTPTELMTISYTDHTQNLGHCNGTGSFTRHWSATDMCGNVAVCIQTVVIIDNTKPILTTTSYNYSMHAKHKCSRNRPGNSHRQLHFYI
ncbi:MAG: hypothetical protein IPP15_07135 [Saprospiraceae bacterium]|uniref:HYR domain-containing protein n=1 Tax=Candidatus Opimibacter skivensis TaxID=2982028 RepID=A0A9D7SSC3_9BACT|nr:hypothetical protein [Candidatus Opimibacter skivensis]